MTRIKLKPIIETKSDYDKIERVILKLFKEEIYLPLLVELGFKPAAVLNSLDDLLSAIHSGQIVYYKGQFRGRFSAALSRELNRNGAEWDRKQGSFSVPLARLNPEVRAAIQVAQAKFEQTTKRIDARLQKIIPAEIAGKLKLSNLFEKTIWKVESDFQKSIKGITIAPNLTEDQVRRMSDEWKNNLELYITDFVEKETLSLRDRVSERVLAGLRYEDLAKEIQKSYGVSSNKAKFLARQETSLAMTKLRQIRYQDAGVNKYEWNTVNMPHDSQNGKHHKGNVRYSHWLLNSKVFEWNNPPVVNEKGDRKNPGQDFNCRCIAVPVINFDEFK